MKANELMVGDWVLWKGKPVQVASVSGVKYSFGHIDVTLAHCNDEKLLETHDIKSIQPIPLIPEILEKNGWEERPTGHVFYTDGKRYDNSLWYIFGSNTFVVNNAEFQINYVHQLQHALKLCGIDKTIEL